MVTTTPQLRRVAVVTLGCARNEVDSEELAGRLAADGLDPRRRARRRRRRPGQHLRVRRGREEGLRRHAAGRRRPQGRRRPARRRGRRVPGRAVRRAAGRGAARGRRRARLRRLRATSARGWPRIVAGERPEAHAPTRPAAAAAGDSRRPGRRRCHATRARRGRHRRTRPGCRPGERAAGRTPAPGRRADGAAQARERVRPPLHASARSPRSAARSCPGGRPTCSPRRAGWPSRACASWCWSARTPRRTARTSATCGCSRRCCRELAAVEGVDRVRVSLPAAGRDPARSRRGDRDDARRRAVLRPVVPARLRAACCAGCGGSADPSAFLELLDAARARAPQAGARSNVIVGFPGETEDDLAELERFLTVARLDAVGVFGYSDEDGTEAGRLRRQAARPTRSRSGSSGSARWPRS